MNENSFAEKFAALRKDRMLSQKEIGEILGVSNKAVSKWETGESIPQMKTIIKISEYFKISPDELLTGTKYEKEKAVSDTVIENDDKRDEAISALQFENQKLKTDLYGVKKKSRRVAVICVAVCAICLMIVLIIVLASAQNNKEPINNSVKSIGQENTSIELLGEKFVPANSFEESLELEFFYDSEEEKKAEFIDENGDKCPVMVYSPHNSQYIMLRKNGKTYTYINEKNRLTPNSENVEYIYFHSEDRYGDKYNQDYKLVTDNSVEYFFKYYNKDNIPKDAQKITKLYLDNSLYSVAFELDSDYGRAYGEAGKIFKDNDGNIYYYDYLTAQTYKMGGELFGQGVYY